MKHIMLDIETLGDESNSVITSIGAVQFDIETGETNKIFHEYISAASCMEQGLKMNPSTIMWWLKQTDEARAMLVEGDEKGLNLVNALSRFASWLRTMGTPAEKLYVWGRGPRFDMGILADAYRATNLPIPWNTRNELCVRTMEFLYPNIKKETKPVDTGHGSEGMGLHNATLDCKFQIAYVCKIFSACKSMNETLNSLLK